MPPDDAVEDELHRGVVELVNGDGVEVSEEPRGDRVTPTSRRTHGSDQLDVH